jgi:hypothetical protein
VHREDGRPRRHHVAGQQPALHRVEPHQVTRARSSSRVAAGPQCGLRCPAWRSRSRRFALA